MTEDFQRSAAAVAACRRGERVQSIHSLRGSEDAAISATCRHAWRTIICHNSKEDVVECTMCGKQQVARCDFDDDFA